MDELARVPYVGRRLLRREDRRLLKGQGQYIADLVLPHMLHATIVRSPRAHAHIRSVDISNAASAPGVSLVLSGADLLRMLPAGIVEPPALQPPPVPTRWQAQVQHKLLGVRQSVLAFDKVRHVGEAIAVIVANSRYEAEDAAELVQLELEPLQAVTNIESALLPDAPIIHDKLQTNLVGEFAVSKGEVDAALSRSPHRLSRRFSNHRYGASPIECRGVVAAYDSRTDTVTVWSATQVVHLVRREIAGMLRLPESRVRCLALDVGGGFGVKGHAYPEDLLIPFLARAIGRPVKWIEDRHEHFMSSCHSRDQLHDIDVGFDDHGHILAFRDSFIMDTGAWDRVGVGIPYNTAVHLLGPYKIENFAARGRIVTTNKVPNAPYRGAGRPEATFAMERTIDLIANELRLDPVDVRRRNMICADEMPYHAGLPYRDGLPIVYDSGDYPGTLQQALDAIGGVNAFRLRQHAARKTGHYLGLGIGCYVEGTGVGPFESAKVRIDPSGTIYVSSGACPQGQGMETILAQVVADEWAVNPDDVVISLADTSNIAIGFGTVASRSTVNVTGAIHFASERLREKVFNIGAHLLECAPTDLELRGGNVGIVGVPGAGVPLSKVAQVARPGWDHGRPQGMEAGLEETYYYEPPTVTWANAAHVAIVNVDIRLGRVIIEKYVVAHDCGITVNPMLLEGQIIGGTVQGLGGVLLEEFGYDGEGQLLTGSFMDYTLPTAIDIPDIDLVHLHSPSPLNPLGVKGVGEGGAIAPPVAIANAVSDALTPFKVEFNGTPIRSEQIVWATLRHIDHAAERLATVVKKDF
jgi:aerobic carbon-monoxide dehydrogenase large subunit